MAVLQPNDIESELSYAYLHAIAAKAGMSCHVPSRHVDNLGIDAEIMAREDFGPAALLSDLTLHVQLKATIAEPRELNGRYSYFLRGTQRYDKLRKRSVLVQRIVVVMFLPRLPAEWLDWSRERLVLQRCAWWESLRGAPASENADGETIYLPTAQAFGPEELRRIMTRIAHDEELTYHG